MYHSITIGTKNTWDDWHLIPKSRPLVNPPSVKTNVVDIPGGDGALDLSTALSGRLQLHVLHDVGTFRKIEAFGLRCAKRDAVQLLGEFRLHALFMTGV